ncbi:ATP-binding protein [Candidatus Micrarchaeota archaeon]|nr:ATP-binding protein [Candidatus Micrarchaeota archaeon]
MDENTIERSLAVGANIVENNARKFPHKRYLYGAVEDAAGNCNHITVIAGLRGTGKTVLLSQLAAGRPHAYMQLDYAPLKSQNLYDVLQYLYKVKGLRLIMLDEFQDSMDFSSLKAFFEEVKGEVSLVISGSSAVALEQPELARRTKRLALKPLSFREYLYFKKGIELKAMTFEELLKTPNAGMHAYSPLMKEYMAEALPYMLAGEADIMELVEKIIRHDLVVFRKLDSGNVAEIEKLLMAFAVWRGKVSFNALSQHSGLEKTQLMRYVSLLKDALLLNEVLPQGSANRVLSKERKIYLSPPFRQGLCRELKTESDAGMLREEFFIHHALDLGPRYLPESGAPDFSIKGRTFEIGGQSKNRKQRPDYLVVDGRVPGKGELPLAAFGLLY